MAAPQKHVLIIEDEKPLAHALELKLTHEGLHVKTANNGKEGVDLLDREHFDVVLLDLMTPVMDGFQVLEHLKSRGTMPTVFVTSNLSQQSDEDRAISLGAQKYFIKSDTPLATIVDEIKAA